MTGLAAGRSQSNRAWQRLVLVAHGHTPKYMRLRKDRTTVRTAMLTAECRQGVWVRIPPSRPHLLSLLTIHSVETASSRDPSWRQIAGTVHLLTEAPIPGFQ